jgi:hypothetical protein
MTCDAGLKSPALRIVQRSSRTQSVDPVTRRSFLEQAIMFVLEEFLDHYERVRQRTKRVDACIPAERLEWAPNPGSGCARWRNTRSTIAGRSTSC